MTRRLFPVSVAVVFACLPIVVLLTVRVGLVFLVPYAVAASVVVVIGTVLPSKANPEFGMFGADVIVLLAIGACAALTGGSESPMLPLMAVALVAGAVRYPQRGLSLYTVAIVTTSLLACLLATNRGVNYDDLRLCGFLTTIVCIFTLVITVTRAEQEYRERSLIDALTGTLNRFSLMRRLEELRAQAELGEIQVCVIASDIDHFKPINDTHGHDVGDAVLREVAMALRLNLRSFPLLFRTGGEEFVAILPDLNADEGAQIAERLRAAVEAARPCDIPVTMSFGVASCGDATITPDELVSAADRCLYRAKEQGRNRVVAETVSTTTAATPASIRRRGLGAEPRAQLRRARA